MISKPLERALDQVTRALSELDADWAVGGAVAMAAQGYRRETADIDLFIGDDVREDLLQTLVGRGVRIAELMPPFHYAVVPDSRVPDERIDLLFPSLGIESLAVMAARPMKVRRRTLPLWPLSHVIAMKLVTDPPVDPTRALKDRADLEQLKSRGLIDATKVLELLEDQGDRGAKRRLRELMQLPQRSRRPRG